MNDMSSTPKRKPDTGLIRPYRKQPADFFQMFVELGWSGIEDHYRASTRVIKRWLNECGPALIEARRERTGYGRKTIRLGLPSEAIRPGIKTGRDLAAGAGAPVD